MAVSPARTAAFDVLLRVATTDAYATELLNSPRYSKLSPPDHGLANELVLGVLRWRPVLDEKIAQRASIQLSKLDPEVLLSLRLAAYQLLFLDRIPAHAAINESVELVKRARKGSASSFVNAVLRNLAKMEGNVAPLLAFAAEGAAALAARLAHPQWIVERWIERYGLETTQKICQYDQKIPPIVIRVADANEIAELQKDGVQFTPGSLLASVRRLVSGNVTRTHLFQEGRLVVQDEASQLVPLLVGKGSRILDCCAAPGGKTRILAERNPDASVVSAEIHPHRARLLRKLVSARNVQVIAADIRQFPSTAVFDRVLVDAPCSGTGTLARNPEIKWRLKKEDLLDLQSRQVEILKSALERVAPGGRLVYSTCSLEPEENEAVLESALTGNHSFRILPCRNLLRELQETAELIWPEIDSIVSGAYLRTIPGVHPCDGFFAAVLEKSPG